LKKGALFILGHVIVSQDFGAAVPEARRQQNSWTKYIDFSRIKAFVNIAISPTVEWGARNIVLGAGLGGMRPNIVVMGFYNLGELRQSKPHFDIPSPQPSRPASKATNSPISRNAIQAAAKRRQTDEMKLGGMLPTDAMKPENAIGIQNYVTILEDLLLRLQINVALAKGFQDLEVPSPTPTKKQKLMSLIGLTNTEEEEPTKTYIDLWPIQMSAEVPPPGTGEDPSKRSSLTTNFDTYTLILQLGCILHTVPSWKRTYKLRVAVFVEYETDVEEEKQRVTMLLKSLRIEADVLVFWLASGSLKMYEVIVNGKHTDDFAQAAEDVDDGLEDEEWWQEIQRLRKPEDMSTSKEFAHASDLLDAVTNWPTSSFQHGRRESKPKRFAELKKLLRRKKHKTSASNPEEADATTSMPAHRLPTNLLSDSESSSSDSAGDDDEEAIATESDLNASDNELDEYDLDASDEDHMDDTAPFQRSKSTDATGGIPFISNRFNLRRALWKGSTQRDDRPTTDSTTPLKPHPKAISSDTAIPTSTKGNMSDTRDLSIDQLSSSPRTENIRPPPIRHQSLPKFTSKPTPRTAVAADEASAGPSIMFVDSPSSSASRNKDPIAFSPVPPPQLAATAASSSTTPPAPKLLQTTLPSTSEPFTATASPSTSNSKAQNTQASGYPLQSAIPLSFNDLPCRAQHLILNELIRQNSDDTAVVFTTLPSPVEGTGESETESVKFISDLEVLCQGLPPCLLVHSNSMTVTMNL
jgi:potassium/chloride transporter 9